MIVSRAGIQMVGGQIGAAGVVVAVVIKLDRDRALARHAVERGALVLTATINTVEIKMAVGRDGVLIVVPLLAVRR